MFGNTNNSDLGGKCGDGLRTSVLKREGTWPTQTRQDGKNNAGPSQWRRHSAALNVAVQFPTPTAKDANGPWRTTHSPSLNAMLFPTPRVNSLCGGTGAWNANQGNPALTADEKRAMTSSAGRSDTYDTPTVHGDGGSGRKGNVPKFVQLNPDWVEWLMGWPVGWTDPECDRPWPFLPLGADPADLPPAMPGYVPRTTMRRDSRAARIRALGNGQVPKCASSAFRIGLELLGEPDR